MEPEVVLSHSWFFLNLLGRGREERERPYSTQTLCWAARGVSGQLNPQSEGGHRSAFLGTWAVHLTTGLNHIK